MEESYQVYYCHHLTNRGWHFFIIEHMQSPKEGKALDYAAA